MIVKCPEHVRRATASFQEHDMDLMSVCFARILDWWIPARIGGRSEDRVEKIRGGRET